MTYIINFNLHVIVFLIIFEYIILYFFQPVVLELLPVTDFYTGVKYLN
jgi:hypothetical protein